MRIVFWGVRGSVPCSHKELMKFGGNTSCVELRTRNNDLIILDAGTGIRSLGVELMRTRKAETPGLEEKVEFIVEKHLEFLETDKPDTLRALEGSQPFTGKAHIFLSHNHWDHIQGFPFFIPAYIPEFEFYIYSQLKADHRLRDVFNGLMGRTYFPIMLNQMGATLHLHEILEDTVVVGDAVVKSRVLNHPQGCLGYRITSGEMSVAYCTDTEHLEDGLNENILELADNADILIYDSQYTAEEYESKKNWGHSTWDEGVKLARAARVKKLIIFHHDPEHDDKFIRELEEEAAKNFLNLMAAHEGLVITDFPVEPTCIEEGEEDKLDEIPAPKLDVAGPEVRIHVGETFRCLENSNLEKAFGKSLEKSPDSISFDASGVRYYGGRGLSALADAIEQASNKNIKTSIAGASKKLIEKLVAARFHLATKIEGYS